MYGKVIMESTYKTKWRESLCEGIVDGPLLSARLVKRKLDRRVYVRLEGAAQVSVLRFN